MNYTLVISICSILVMLFSAYVAYKTFELQKDARRPRLVYSKQKYEFQYYIEENQFHLVQWLICAQNSGGETAIVDSIVFSIKINNIMYMGKIKPQHFRPHLVPPGATFTIDLSDALGDKSIWTLKKEDDSDDTKYHKKTYGFPITDIDPSEVILMAMNGAQNMSYQTLILYRLNGTDSSITQPYRLKIDGLIKNVD